MLFKYIWIKFVPKTLNLYWSKIFYDHCIKIKKKKNDANHFFLKKNSKKPKITENQEKILLNENIKKRKLILNKVKMTGTTVSQNIDNK